MPEPPLTPRSVTAMPPGAPAGSIARQSPFDQTWRWAHTWTIALEGEVDDHVIVGLQQQIADALTGYDCVVIDLRAVRVLSTHALASMCAALRRAYRPGATLTVSDAPAAARQALQACELPGMELDPRTRAWTGHEGTAW